MKDLTSSVYSFENLIQGKFLYVDKTEFLWQMVRPANGMYFLSRPRRFGKSLTLSTLKAIFEGKKELFKGLAIYGKLYDWPKYPVIHLSLGDFSGISDTPEKVEAYLLDKVGDLAQDFGVELPPAPTSARAFGKLINQLAKKSHGQVVILVDEYDKPILDNLGQANVKDILKCLKGFYGVLKDCNVQERFLFVTGVSKFCHVSLFSELNNLTDITMDTRFATMLGYTQAELESNFGEYIRQTEAGQSLGHEEYLRKIKEWYDGYRFEENAQTVYNPVSLAKFFISGGKFGNYWFSTGTPSFLLELTKSRDFHFEETLTAPVSEVSFSAFEVDSIDPLALLFQTGYVTIKSTTQDFGQTWYHLDFPNHEVEDAFTTYLLHSYAGKQQGAVVQFTAEFAHALRDDDLERLHQAMESFFAGIPYTAHKKNEATFQAIFFALFRLLGEYVEAESTTSNGRVDAVVQTERAIYLFEFKLDSDPTALSQIQRKQYFQKFLQDKREIHLIGANFDSEKGSLIGWRTARAKRHCCKTTDVSPKRRKAASKTRLTIRMDAAKFRE